MKKDCSPSKVRAYKGLKEPTCECAACWAKYAVVLGQEGTDDSIFAAGTAVQNFFWYRFSQLVYEAVDLVPELNQDDLWMQLGDMTSLYSIAERIKK